MNGKPLEIDTRVILSVSRSLLGEITPDVRAIAVGWHGETVRARFIYDRPPTEDNRYEILIPETEVVADCWPKPVEFTADYVGTLPVSHLPGESWWTYARREFGSTPSGVLKRTPLWSGIPLRHPDAESPDFRVKVMLSVQQALLGVVTPDIRAVIAGWEGHVARVRVIFDRPVVDEDRMTVEAVEAAVAIDFGGLVPTSSAPEFSTQRPFECDVDRWAPVYFRRERED